MIYQMKIYYGASINNQAIYSMETSLDNCTAFPDKIDENIFKERISHKIIEEGFNPDDFVIGYLTKEQYNNRYSKDTEKVTTITIKK